MKDLKNNQYKQWIVGTTIGLAALIIAILTWQLPKQSQPTEPIPVRIVNPEPVQPDQKQGETPSASGVDSEKERTGNGEPVKSAAEVQNTEDEVEPKLIINELFVYAFTQYGEGSGDYVPFKEDRTILVWDIRNAKAMELQWNEGTNATLLDKERGAKVLSAGTPEGMILKIYDRQGTEFVRRPKIRLMPRNADFDAELARLKSTYQ